MVAGGSGENTAELLKTIKSLEVASKSGQLDQLNQYQQDLLRWSRNVDKRYAWVVLIALWLVIAACMGPFRSYGLIFAKVSSDGVYTREEASWPVATIITVENVAGLLVSVICYHISFRAAIFIGGFLLTAGNFMAYYSGSLLMDVFTIGIVQGIGFAFIFMPFMKIINSYFLKYRSAALGFCLCGSTFSVFGLSPLLKWILDTYEWRASYVFIGIVSSIIILVVPLLRPNPQPKEPENYKHQALSANTLTRLSFRALSYQSSHRKQSPVMVSSNRNSLDRNESIISVNPFTRGPCLERKVSQVSGGGNDQNGAAAHKAAPSSGQTTQLPTTGETNYETKSQSELDRGLESDFKLSQILDIFKTPGWHLVWYLEFVHFWIFTIITLILVDYGIDHGCMHDEAESLLNYQSVGEIIGRMGLTILVDMNFMSIRSWVILNLMVGAALLVGFTQVNGYFAIATLTVLINAFTSPIYILINGLLVQFLGEQQVTIGFGMASCVVGVLITFRPQAVGYFRDTLGSYDLLMVGMAAACVVGASLCVLEAWWTERQERRDKTQAGSTSSIA